MHFLPYLVVLSSASVSLAVAKPKAAPVFHDGDTLPMLPGETTTEIASLHKRDLISSILCGIGLFGSCTTTTINTNTDIKNCGTLGNICPSSYANGVGSVTCVNGQCTSSCASGFGFSQAAKGCISTSNDVNNCGSVGTVCSITNAVPKCTSGSCSIASCVPGAYLVNGACTLLNLQTDPKNCGTVGYACNLAGASAQTCSGGLCSATTCSAGFNRVATVTPNNYICQAVNTNTDVNNCGAVGRACPTSYTNGLGPTVCVGAVCQPTSCISGFAFDGSISACRNTATDPLNCGAVGRKCSVAGTVSGCSAGSCTVASCTSPYKLVNGACTLTTASQRARVKRAKEPEPIKLCPGRETACPIVGTDSFYSAQETGFSAFRAPDQSTLAAIGGYECLDTSEAIESCGGCQSMGEGVNCLEIPHALGVGCSVGSCKVFTCTPGFQPNHDLTGCVRVPVQAARPRRSHGHVKRAVAARGVHHYMRPRSSRH